jgi:hypothetical protein
LILDLKAKNNVLTNIGQADLEACGKK